MLNLSVILLFIQNIRPIHDLTELMDMFSGALRIEYMNPAYGIFTIILNSYTILNFDF